MRILKPTSPSAPPAVLRRRALFVAAVAVAGIVTGCKGPENPPGETPPGPTTMNTPMGNMRSGMPQTLPVETSPPTGATTAPHPPTVMGTESREPAVALPATVPVTPAVTPPPVVTPAAIPPPAPTHVLTADEPYFTGPPAAGDKPAGTLATGSKVLLVIPGTPYSQVKTSEGMDVYTVTDGLKPVGDK